MLSRRLITAVFGCLPLLFLALAAAMSQPAPDATTINWRTDYEQARREAKQTGKPLFVVFRCER